MRLPTIAETRREQARVGETTELLDRDIQARRATRQAGHAVEPRNIVSPRARQRSEPHWPAIDDCAFYGLAGEAVHAIKPHTEADPIALLVQLLTAFGNCVGRGPHYLVEGDAHYPNLYAVMVGESSKARKGTSWGRIRWLFEALDDEPWAGNVQSGLSSGEGLIWAVRNPVRGTKRQGKAKMSITSRSMSTPASMTSVW